MMVVARLKAGTNVFNFLEFYPLPPERENCFEIARETIPHFRGKGVNPYLIHSLK
jgi:hypothetical protein